MTTLNLTAHRSSACGRPRRVTDAMIAEILAWHAARLTLAQKAATLGISTNTLETIVKTGGTHYKQPSPELRQRVIHRARAERERLHSSGWL
jgi:hypothetical protein